MKKHLFTIIILLATFHQNLKAQNPNENSQDLLSIYEELHEFSEGFAAAKKDGKWGYIDIEGKPITPFIYDAYSIYSTIFPFQNGFAKVCQGDFLGLINTDGKQITPCKYHLIDNFSEGLAGVSAWDESKEDLELMYGFIDKTGKEVIPLIYNGGGEFIGGRAAVFKGEKNGYINARGEVIAGLKYELVAPYSDDYALVKNDGKYGFIDEDGKLQIDLIYDDAGHFSEGLAVVSKGGYYGYINKKGEAITKFEYSVRSLFSPLEKFENGLVVVFKHYGFCNCIDNRGNELLPNGLDDCRIDGDLIEGSKNGKITYFDREGNQLMPYIYEQDEDEISFNEGLRAVSKNDKWGYINKNGAEVIPMIYGKALNFENGKAKVWIGENELNVENPLLQKPNIVWHNDFETAFFDSTYQMVLEVKTKKRINEKRFLQSLQIKINGEEPPIKDLDLVYKEKEEEAVYELQATIEVPTTWGDYHLTAEMEVEKEPLFIGRYFHNMHPVLRQFLRPRMENTKVILNAHYDEIAVSDTMVRAYIGDTCVYEKRLKHPFPITHDHLSEGLKQIEVERKVGYVNLEGDTIIPPIYDLYPYEHEDLICLSKDEQYGCIDTLGKTVIPFIYDNMGEFRQGIAMVEKWGGRGFIDREGNPIIEMSFDNVYHYGNGLINVEYNRKEGLIYYKKIKLD